MSADHIRRIHFFTCFTCKVTVETDVMRFHSETNLKNDVAMSMGKYLETGRFSDVILVCQKEEFRCHINVLSIRSPVFSAMFKSHTKE